MMAEQATAQPAVGQPPQQPAPQPQDQQVVPGAPATASPGQVSPQPSMVQVPVRDIPRRYGSNVHQAFHDANAHFDLRDTGWLGVIEAAQRQGLDPFQLAANIPRLTGEGQGPVADAPQGPPAAAVPAYPYPGPLGIAPPPSATGYPPYDPYGTAMPPYDPSQEFPTREQVEKLADERAERKFNELLAKHTEQTEKQAERASRFEAQDIAYDEALEAMGFKRNPREMTWMGQDGVKIDPDYYAKKAMLRQAAEQAHMQRIPAGLPKDEYAKRVEDPIEPALIHEMAEHLKPYFAGEKLDAAEQVADEQRGIPHESLPAGPGGRPQKSPDDMSDQEKSAEAGRRAAARGALKGTYD